MQGEAIGYGFAKTVAQRRQQAVKLDDEEMANDDGSAATATCDERLEMVTCDELLEKPNGDEQQVMESDDDGEVMGNDGAEEIWSSDDEEVFGIGNDHNDFLAGSGDPDFALLDWTCVHRGRIQRRCPERQPAYRLRRP